jgi:cation transport regulator ChaB
VPRNDPEHKPLPPIPASSYRDGDRRTTMPASKEMPDTIKRSPKHAQSIWSKAHDSAVDEYGEGERAHRTAFSALKHEYEKVGDHWEKKDKAGPSDRKAAGGRNSAGKTRGGVNANASKQHLYDVAKKPDISGRSTMDKVQLVDAIEKANRRETRKAREK